MYISGKLVASYNANHYTLLLSGDEIPNMEDLRSNFVRQHAAEWKRLALELGVKDEDIRDISKNYTRHPKKCCNAMLDQWQKETRSLSWRSKLYDAIKNIKQSTTSHDKEGNQGYYYTALNSLMSVLQPLSCSTKPM